MIKYICKKCNINTETSVCPVCGERAEVESSTIYWCDDCNIPLYIHDYLGDKPYAGTIQVCIGPFNTDQDIDDLVESLESL